MALNKVKFMPLFIILIISFIMMGCNSDGVNKDEVAEDIVTEEVVGVEVDQLADPVLGDTVAILTTNKGVMKAKLFPELVPVTIENFKFHAEKDNYDGTIFHRIIQGFMIQGGDIEGLNGRGGYSFNGPGTTIDEEFDPNLKHHYGALSMAKTMFPGTTGSQFFIVHAENGTPHLDGAHSVFGQLYEGFEILEAIADVETDGDDKPFDDVVLENVEIMVFE